MRHRFAAPLFAVLVLALAAFTGSALAGDGHGNGSGDSSKAAKDTHGSTSSTGDNRTGVKPSNQTSHDTHAAASSDKTKQYGNGQTAGQIATKSGHGGDTLHGPGNSQPHKTTACPHGHEVDVHALKHKDAQCGTSEHSKQAEHQQAEHQQAEHQQAEQKQNEVEAQKVEIRKAEEQKTSESQGVAASAHAHVTICHATGSSSNPFVMISPSASGVFHGHLAHQGGRDIIPPFTWNGQKFSENWDANGMAIFNAGCTVPAAQAQAQAQAQVAGAQATQTQNCGTTTQTVTEQVLVGVKHMIGPKGSGRFVLIHPSTNSAHFTGKHPGDIPVFETVTKTITVPVTNCAASPVTPAATLTPSNVSPSASAPAATAQSTAAGAVAPATVTNAAAPVTPASTPAPAGGVKGAVVALKPTKTKPAGGVLGATTRLGGRVAATRLPFTGLPLWIFALVAGGLIGIGLTVRRASANRM